MFQPLLASLSRYGRTRVATVVWKLGGQRAIPDRAALLIVV